MREKLTIFDLGMHNGDDSSYYLERGFKVIAVEANVELCDECNIRFKREISRGDLVIINKAIWERNDQTIEFYISSLNSEWSTIHRNPHMLGENPRKITVGTITLDALISQFGVPHYIKCDIEGSDIVFCQQLSKKDIKPDFVSAEATSLEVLGFLMAAGYDKFQLINNAKVRRFASMKTFEDSVYGNARAKITGHCSGEFGFDLDSKKWLTFEEAAYRWLKHVDLQKTDPDMTIDNWFDFHATNRTVLKRQAAPTGDGFR